MDKLLFLVWDSNKNNMTFNKWSQLNPNAKKVISPDLGIRSWDQIDKNQKQTIWLHFINKGWFNAGEETYRAIKQFNEDNMAGSFCNHLQQHGETHYHEMRGIDYGIKSCCYDVAQRDFDHIFHTLPQDIFYELLSYYASILYNDTLDKKHGSRFENLFNNISNQFGLNVLLNNNGFILRQDPKITAEIYVPVLNYLNDKKWEAVNRDLTEATAAYLKNTEEGYSAAVTLIVAALQAFMQILVNGEIGKGDLGDLVKEAQVKKIIPDDSFSVKIFKDIESVLMQERKTTGNAHPKKEYADEKSTRLVLNLAMIFMQHCIQ
jgi:hypothetical protein